MRTIALFLVLAGMAVGAYSTTPVEVKCALTGSETSGATTMLAGSTYCDKSFPFTTDGTVDDIKIRLISPGGTNTGKAVLYIIDHTDNSIKSSLDVTTSVNAARTTAGASSFIYSTKTAGVSTAAMSFAHGDWVAVYLSTNIRILGNDTSVDGLSAYAGEYTDPGTQSFADYAGTESFAGIVTCLTTSRVLSVDDTGYVVGDSVSVGRYAAAQYYAFEGVIAPDGKQLDLEFCTVNNTRRFTVRLSFDAGDGDNYATLFAASYANTNQFSIAGQEGDRFDVYVYLVQDGTTAAQGNVMAAVINRKDGVAGGNGIGSGDVRLSTIPINGVSFTTFAVTAGYAAYPVNRIRLAGTAGEGGATVEKITVCREPVLLLGDSFAATYPSSGDEQWSQLARVGLVLGAAFSEDRFVINAGITGNQVTNNSANNTNLLSRWKSTSNSLSALRDVVVVLLNGPGLNDISADSTVVSGGIAGTLMRIASDAMDNTAANGLTNDIVMSELIPYPAGSTAKQALVVDLNAKILTVATSLGVPLAKTFAGYNATWYEDAGTHPDADGCNYIAGQIADAYESNRVPVQASSGSSGLFPGGLFSN